MSKGVDVLFFLHMYICVLLYDVSVMWTLVKINDQVHCKEVSAVYCLVPGREYSVGREGCDLTIDSQTASRRHATLSVIAKCCFRGSQVWVTDESLYGTYVNSQRHQNSVFEIFNGDEVIFGKWSSFCSRYTYHLRWEPKLQLVYEQSTTEANREVSETTLRLEERLNSLEAKWRWNSRLIKLLMVAGGVLALWIYSR